MTRLPLVSNPYYSFDFPKHHRFPMRKFLLLHRYLQEQGVANRSNLYRPGHAKSGLLELAHCPDYIARFRQGRMTDKEQRRMGLPWSSGLVRRSLISPNGTMLTAILALRFGMACHLAGGTHHAHRDFTAGYCVFNDLAIAALALLAQNKVQRVLIFDCDVHQGDGTATILENVPGIITCSIHCQKNFPHRKANSDHDIEIPPGTEDDDYLAIVSNTLNSLLEQAEPDLVLYDAGVDIYFGDPLGLLNITENGIRARDALVLETVTQRGIPVATVIGGGYDDDEHRLARRHAIVVEEANRIFNAG